MPDTQGDAASAARGGLAGRQPSRHLRIAAREGRSVFVVSRLDAHDAEAYGDLTVPAHRPLLAQISEGGAVVAVGGNRFGRAIGLGLARVSEDGAVGTVLWLFVRPGYRGIGMGTALLAALERVLAERGCRRLSLVYTDGVQADAGLDALLQRAGWSPAPRCSTPRPPVSLGGVGAVKLLSSDQVAE